MVTLNLGSNLLPVRPYSGAGLRGAPDKNPATFPREDGSMKKCAVAVTGARGEGKDAARRSGASTIGTYLPGRATSLTDIVAPEIFNYWNRWVVSHLRRTRM